MFKKALPIIIVFIVSSCSHLFYLPNNIKYSNPENMDIDFEESFVKVEKEVELLIWKLRPKGESKVKGTILFFHGNAQNISAHIFQVKWLLEYGYAVYMWDYRGYGISDGKPSQESNVKDGLIILEDAYNWHLKNKAEKFLVYAQSLGGNIAIPVLAQSKLKDKVSAFIIEGSFMRYRAMALDKVTANWLLFPAYPFAYFFVSDEFAGYKFIKQLKTQKALVIHSKEDQVVPYKFGREIYDEYPGPKAFWSYENIKHIRIFKEEANRKKLVNYLDAL